MQFVKVAPVSKKLINSPNTCVDEMLNGISATYPGLSVCTSSRIVMRVEPDRGVAKHIGVVSGGGSGHEPFASGYVGKGMLNAAVAGSVFSSPPTANCLTAIKNIAEHCQGGVLVLILNYTGDILNFGQAIEIARDEGINIDSLIVGDDCALIGAEERIVGRRGLSGMLFVIKIAGALAVAGQSLNSIKQQCEEVSERMATLGICLSPCTVPGSDTPLFTLADHQMELGVGIHGEAGVLKINVCQCSEIVDIIIRKISSTLMLKTGDEVCAIINNLGGSSQLESFVVANELNKQLEKRGIMLVRLYVGTLMTSIEMAGIQISLLKTTEKSEWIKLLDDSTEAPAWPGSIVSFEKHEIDIKKTEILKSLSGPEINEDQSLLIKKCLEQVSISLKKVEQQLNLLDSGCGDGDCGTTMAQFAEAIIQNIEELPLNRPMSCMLELEDIASKCMGGTTGGLYSLMFRGAARDAPNWTMAWKSALEIVKKYTPARVGYRTMMDALIPAFEEFEEKMEKTGDWRSALSSAVQQAEVGCQSTRKMRALLGRASYVDEKYWNDVDAGAFAVTVWLKAIYNTLTGTNADAVI